MLKVSFTREYIDKASLAADTARRRVSKWMAPAVHDANGIITEPKQRIIQLKNSFEVHCIQITGHPNSSKIKATRDTAGASSAMNQHPIDLPLKLENPSWPHESDQSQHLSSRNYHNNREGKGDACQ